MSRDRTAALKTSSSAIVGLDIGTSKVKLIIAEPDPNGGLPIINGLGEAESKGVASGHVMNVNQAADAVRRAVEAAEQFAGIDVKRVYVSISGKNTWSLSSTGQYTVSKAGNREINGRDVDAVIDQSSSISRPADTQIIHVIPNEFTVDGQPIPDPCGCTGVRLEATVQLILANSRDCDNLRAAVERAGLQVEEIVLGSLAACESVLTEEEKQMGVAVIDLGAGTTNVAVYCRGSLHFAASTSIGCEMVTSDLTKCLHIDDKQAEEIKCRYGACSVPEVADCDVSLRGLGNRAERQEKRSRIAEFIEPRVREILEDAQELLVRNNLTKLLVAGVVLTGGGCQINGIEKVAADVFGDLPVAIGYPRTSATGLSRVAATPGLATCVGLVDYAANRIHAGESRPGAGSAGFVKTVAGGIAAVLRKLF